MNKNNKLMFTIGRILFALPFGIIGFNHFIMYDFYQWNGNFLYSWWWFYRFADRFFTDSGIHQHYCQQIYYHFLYPACCFASGIYFNHPYPAIV